MAPVFADDSVRELTPSTAHSQSFTRPRDSLAFTLWLMVADTNENKGPKRNVISFFGPRGLESGLELMTHSGATVLNWFVRPAAGPHSAIKVKFESHGQWVCVGGSYDANAPAGSNMEMWAAGRSMERVDRQGGGEGALPPATGRGAYRVEFNRRSDGLVGFNGAVGTLVVYDAPLGAEALAQQTGEKPCDPDMEVRVRMLSGELFTLACSRRDTARDIARRVQALNEIPWYQQRFTLEGTGGFMDSRFRSLGEYGVVDGTTLQLVVQADLPDPEPPMAAAMSPRQCCVVM